MTCQGDYFELEIMIIVVLVVKKWWYFLLGDPLHTTHSASNICHQEGFFETLIFFFEYHEVGFPNGKIMGNLFDPHHSEINRNKFPGIKLTIGLTRWSWRRRRAKKSREKEKYISKTILTPRHQPCPSGRWHSAWVLVLVRSTNSY